jgi:hypothetical protein
MYEFGDIHAEYIPVLVIFFSNRKIIQNIFEKKSKNTTEGARCKCPRKASLTLSNPCYWGQILACNPGCIIKTLIIKLLILIMLYALTGI